jgi:membrane associated rhomboid family serine protease
MGHIRFLIFYFLSGIGANVINILIDIHSRIPEFGASGAIARVMGAGGVGWWAHIGGLAFGIAFLPFLKKKERSYRRSSPDEAYRYINRS